MLTGASKTLIKTFKRLFIFEKYVINALKIEMFNF